MGSSAAKTVAPTARFACVDLPGLALQVLRRDRPELRGHPLAVVAEDRPDAPLMQVDRAARRLHLKVGMRFGAAQSLVPSLRAAVVSRARIDEVRDELMTALTTFSPRVEPDTERPGTFFVDPSGLGRIYGSLRTWAESVHAYLKARHFVGAVVVADERFAAFAIARTVRGPLVLAGRGATRQRLDAVPLSALDVSPRLSSDLAALSVRTVGDLIALPAGELRSRFGAEAARLQALAANEAQLPMQPRSVEEPLTVSLEIDPPDHDHARLLFGIKGALHELLTNVTARSLVLRALSVDLHLESGGGAGGGGAAEGLTHHERIEPASPTRDAMGILELVRLRLADVTLVAPVEIITLTAETARPEGDQLTMFRMGPKRDLRAGERALARVRAAFGEGAVGRARLRDAHLPEARFTWEPADRLRLANHPAPQLTPKPGPATKGCVAAAHRDTSANDQELPPLIRRVLARPRPLRSRDRDSPGLGPVLDGGETPTRLYGPYRVSGGWWVRAVERDYYYAETDTGDLLWLFWDRPRKRWFLHGIVD